MSNVLASFMPGFFEWLVIFGVVGLLALGAAIPFIILWPELKRRRSQQDQNPPKPDGG